MKVARREDELATEENEDQIEGGVSTAKSIHSKIHFQPLPMSEQSRAQNLERGVIEYNFVQAHHYRR